MKLNLFMLNSLILLIGVSILSSCKIETGKPTLNKKLTIASDYLVEKDSVIFSDFSKKHQVQVTIRPIKASKLIGMYRNSRFNSGIDVFMMKMLTDVNEIHQREIVQPVISNSNFVSKNEEHISTKYSFVEFGYDPYIIVSQKNKRSPIRMFNDLTRHAFKTNLSNEELIPLFSPIASKMKRVDANNWVKSFYKHIRLDSLTIDSTKVELPLLTFYSDFQSMTDKQKESYKFVFPNNRTSGTFYNSCTFLISYQAENYAEADSFISFYMKKENNEKLNQKINTISLSSDKHFFRKYYSSPESLMQYYLNISRLIEKIHSE